MNDTVNSNLCRNPDVPSQLQMNCKIFSDSQYVESNILDPVVSSSSHCRFVLPTTGFMSPSARLLLTLTTPSMLADGTANYFLPANIGIFSLINRVQFLANGKTISNCEDENFLQAFKQCFSMAERVYQSKGATNAIYGSSFKNIALDPAVEATKDDQEVLMWDSMFEYNAGSSTSAANEQAADEFLQLQTGIEYSVDLSQILPFIQGNLLPLYLMTDMLEIEIFFDVGANYYRGYGSADNTIGNVTIDHTKTRLAIDTIIYPDSVMDSFRNNEPVITSQDVDYILWKRDFTKINNTFGGGSYQLGGGNRYVDGVILMWNDDFRYEADPAQVLSSSFYNKFYGQGPQGLNGKNEYNLLVNGANLYPRDIDNPALQYTELQKFDFINGKPEINRTEWLNDDFSSLSSKNFERHNLKNNNSANKNFIYIPVDRMVNTEGLVLSILRTDNASADTQTSVTLRAFVMVRSQITIDKKMGKMYQRFV